MKRIILFFLSVCFSFAVFSQTNKTFPDEKTSKLLIKRIDTLQVEILLEKAKVFFNNKELDSANIYYKKALVVAKGTKSKLHIANCLFWIGDFYQGIDSYKEAIIYYIKAIEVYSEIGDVKDVAEVQNKIGSNYISLYEENNAITYFFKSLKNYESLNDMNGIAVNYIDIGNLYYEIENYEFAKRYFTDALKICEELDDKYGISTCYTNLGNVSADSGDRLNGVKFYLKSIEIEKELNRKDAFAANYNNIGDCFLIMGKLNKAKTYFFKSLKIIKEIDDAELEEIVYLNLADLFIRNKNFQKSIHYAKKGLELARIKKSLDIQLELLDFLALGYEKLGDKSMSLQFLKECKKLNDSINTVDKIKKVQLFNTLNELEKSNFKIDELSEKSELAELRLENEKKFNYFLVISMVGFAVLIIILLFQHTSIKKAYNLLEFKNHQINKMNDEIKTQANNLAKINQTKDKFFSIIAHDLKNPFNSIMGFTDLLMENIRNYDEEKRLKFLKIIKGSATKASDLLSNLLIWANSQSGNLKFSPEKIEIVKQVADVISLLEIQAINKDISIYNNVHHNMFVAADKNMLSTILRNLISNSIKFSNPGDSITISTFLDKNSVNVLIQDQGVGMSEETIGNLFNVESKDSKIGTANEQGSGLGLVLCKDFVEKHGGEISVTSTINKGSLFKFSLPKYEE
ncbi:tetratricopeptide repeat-containing sensor histidine kinase [Lutibacter citreus]|uniref:tetratricopeptide repeat-containing sensor histidine kinase n=1 Tax=Lutibacter citreus TaxID=2138210 RepID=UPI000DBE7279|nr:tetratricopeptide repeat-containing sensor histidine kinase [Lutibacter citreus]